MSEGFAAACCAATNPTAFFAVKGPVLRPPPHLPLLPHHLKSPNPSACNKRTLNEPLTWQSSLTRVPEQNHETSHSGDLLLHPTSTLSQLLPLAPLDCRP